nr:mucin-2-like [Procambarus clarkii]
MYPGCVRASFQGGEGAVNTCLVELPDQPGCDVRVGLRSTKTNTIIRLSGLASTDADNGHGWLATRHGAGAGDLSKPSTGTTAAAAPRTTRPKKNPIDRLRCFCRCYRLSRPSSGRPSTNPPARTSTGTNPPARTRTGTNPPARTRTGTNPPARTSTGTNPPARTRTGTNPPARTSTGTNPPARTSTGTNPPARTSTGTNPPARTRTGTNPPARTSTGTNPPARTSTGTNPPARTSTGTNPPARTSTGTNQTHRRPYAASSGYIRRGRALSKEDRQHDTIIHNDHWVYKCREAGRILRVVVPQDRLDHLCDYDTFKKEIRPDYQLRGTGIRTPILS